LSGPGIDRERIRDPSRAWPGLELQLAARRPSNKIARINVQHVADEQRRDALSCDVIAEELAEVASLLATLVSATSGLADSSLGAMVRRAVSDAATALRPLANYVNEHGAGEWRHG
jgi:hypothetical protein